MPTQGRTPDDTTRDEPPAETAKTETQFGPRRGDMRETNLGRGGRARQEKRDDTWWNLAEEAGEELFDQDPEAKDYWQGTDPLAEPIVEQEAASRIQRRRYAGIKKAQVSPDRNAVTRMGHHLDDFSPMTRRGLQQRGQQSPLRFYKKGTEGMWTGNMGDALSSYDWGAIGMWASGTAFGAAATELWHDRRKKQATEPVEVEETFGKTPKDREAVADLDRRKDKPH